MDEYVNNSGHQWRWRKYYMKNDGFMKAVIITNMFVVWLANGVKT